MVKKLSLSYPAKITPDLEGFTVSFRDLKNVFSEGETYSEALFNAQQVIDLLLEDMLHDGLSIPKPSAKKPNEVLVAVSPEIAVPVMLHQLREDKHYSLMQVARSMGVSYQAYQQIESGKNITLKSLKRAAAALGVMVEIKLYFPATK